MNDCQDTILKRELKRGKMLDKKELDYKGETQHLVSPSVKNMKGQRTKHRLSPKDSSEYVASRLLMVVTCTKKDS